MSIRRFLKSLSLSVFSAASLGLAVAPVEAKTYQFEAGGIEFEINDKWGVQVDGDEVLVSGLPDDETFMLAGMRLQTKAFPEIFSLVNQAVFNKDFILPAEPVSAEDFATGEVNGLKTHSLEGKGTVGGRDVHWKIAVVMIEEPVVLMSIVRAEDAESHAEDFKTFFSSVNEVAD